MQPIPRKLTTDQKAVLIQVRVAFPDQQVDVSYHPAASDARDYAQDFLTVFRGDWVESERGCAVRVLEQKILGTGVRRKRTRQPSSQC